MKFIIISLIFMFLFLSSCTLSSELTSNVVKEPYSDIQIYFCPEDMCLEKLLDLIDSSTEIRCALYDLDIPELTDKLKEKSADVVIEDSNALPDFLTGYSSALMHNKFCIFDQKIIFTGSMNPTERGNYYNNNNIMIIESVALAQNYLEEFFELKDNIYGKGNRVKRPKIDHGGILIENYFCPEDNCKLHVINTLKKAEKSIYFMTYSFTDVDIGNLLYNKNYEGLDVKGIFESKQLSDYSRYGDLKEVSMIDRNKYTMHHKVFIIDEMTVITGSYNPSKNANERNDENVLIIHDSGIAQKFIAEFNHLWNIDYETMPEKTGDIVIKKIVPNPEGKDEGNEYIVLSNKGDINIDLSYYFISDNNTNSRLSGIIEPYQTLEIHPKFSLKNKQGISILKKNMIQVDYAIWGADYGLDVGEGEALVRVDSGRTGSDAWEIE
ncbi:MAG: lamin tail domain-containing protein [Nanoarchaeota archaeon]|nr:lamin tail domain-containing protein [Nanoarchaeota archaeon]